MYKELDKYKTGKKITKKTNLIQVGGKTQIIDYDFDEYVFNLGDLMEDYINHQTKPFWKRKYYHNHLSKMYKDTLNEVSIRTGI